MICAKSLQWLWGNPQGLSRVHVGGCGVLTGLDKAFANQIFMCFWSNDEVSVSAS